MQSQKWNLFVCFSEKWHSSLFISISYFNIQNTRHALTVLNEYAHFTKGNEYENTYLKLTWLRYLVVFVILLVSCVRCACDVRVFAFLFPFFGSWCYLHNIFRSWNVEYLLRFCSLFKKIIRSYIINLNIAWICCCYCCCYVIQAYRYVQICYFASLSISLSLSRSRTCTLHTTYGIPFSAYNTQGQHSY